MTIRISHHLLLCVMSQKEACCDSPSGLKTWDKLKTLLKKFDLEDPKRSGGIVLRSKVDCLRICKNGPILLIWPDGIWYGGVTTERMEVILYEHIMRGNPCSDWIIKKTPQVFN